ncbi:MAG: SoxR reducing system RseC family protein [Gammaproteobacteria bacterium]
MLETQGKVTRVEPGYAWVDVQPVSACGGCGQQSSCGTSALASVLGRRRSDLRVIDEQGVNQGDRVVVGLHESAMFRTALMVYGLPILGLVLGAVFASLGTGRGDFAAAIGAALGMGLGWWLARQQAARLMSDPRYHPVIIRPTLKGTLVAPAWTDSSAR